MANEIDLVVGSEAFAQITKLLVELGKVDTELTALSTSFSNLGKGATNPQSSAELTKLTENNAKLNAQILELTKSYDALNKKLSEGVATAITKSKYTTQETTDLRLVNKELGLQNVKASELAGAYEKLSAAHKIARGTAADLAAVQGTQSKEFLAAAANANAYDKKLKEIDQNLGQHGRHVGDYARSWNGLGNSINQLTREAPAFANSVSTGFMALSNNIPILTDEIGNLINKNKELVASGKPTESIFKTLAGAFFSWQTAISLGVTLLTVYGAQLWEAAFGLSELEKRQNAVKETISNLDNTTSEYTVKLKTLSGIVLDTTKGDKDRKLALLELKEIIPEISNLDIDHVESLKQITFWTNKYIEAGIDRAKVDVLTKKIAEGQTELDIAKTASSEKALNWYQKVYFGIAKMTGTQERAARVIKNSIVQEQLGMQNGLDTLNVLLGEYTIKANKANKELLGLQDDPKKNGKGSKSVDKSAEEATKKEEERLKKYYETLLSNAKRQKELDKDALESFNGTIEAKTNLSIQLAATETDIANIVFEEKKILAKGDVELIRQAENEKATAVENAGQENIKRVEKYYDELIKSTAEYYKNNPPLFVESKDAKDARENELKDKKHQNDLLQELDGLNNKETEDKVKKQADYLKGFVDDLGSKMGMTETFKMMSGNIEGFGTNTAVTFNAIAESAQEMFSMISQNSEANFQAELGRLDAQKTESLKYAGDSSVAKAKIEEEYAKKKNEIEVRQFKEKQKIAVANIAIDTAQAIMGLWVKPGFPAAIPMALVVGAMGAVQMGMVMAQKPPAYAEGTDNHSGGLMLVNDGKGSNFEEKVILPSGKVIRPQGRNVLMDAPKGTKVLNHEQQLFEMLQNNNISMSEPKYQGMTSEEMDMILEKHFSNIKTQNTIFDKNGFQSYVKNGNSITRSNSNRSQAIGISV